MKSDSGVPSMSSSSLSDDCVANEAGDRRVGSVGMVSGCEALVVRSRKKVGDVGEFCGVLRRRYEEMGVYAIESVSDSMRLSGLRERRPRKDALIGDRRGEVERAYEGRQTRT